MLRGVELGGNGTTGVCMALAFAGVRVLIDAENGLGAALTRETAARNGNRSYGRMETTTAKERRNLLAWRPVRLKGVD